MPGTARSLTRITRSDRDFDRLRRGWNQRFQANPFEVVLPTDTREVSLALQDARDRGLPVRIRSGGHSVDGFSAADDAVVIDLRSLDGIDIDPDAKYAEVGAGARIHAVYESLAAHGRVIPGGVSHTVGMGGFITGGGLGTLARWLGAMAHNVAEFDIVDARGDIRRVTPQREPDLYWACLGAGGGNFGVITKFVLRLTPMPTAVWFRLSWPWNHFEAVYDAWQRWAPSADPRLTPFLAMWPTTTANRIDVGGLFPGTEEELAGLLAPLFDLGPAPAEREVTVTTFTAAMSALLQKIADDSFDSSTRAVTASPFFAEPLSHDVFGALRESHVGPPGNSFVWCLPGGGQLTAAADRGTESFAHGRAHHLMLIRSDWSDPRDDEACTSWAGSLYRHVSHRATGAYLNWTNTDIEARPQLFYGDNFPRLVETKHRYDPDGVFDFDNGIPASVSLRQAQRLALPDTMVAELRSRGRLVE
ncbi:FAD-binding oxidoreductase [Nocardia sp. BMG51109]|uniref:FAD-binding oxidoreductase n=1 Tax=Nocardia sp. BMG51109 TaxID=1056816 RepID=UPI0004672BFA|nr:FAD-binding oxidoreductase [Nocardia sp. BMG51109]